MESVEDHGYILDIGIKGTKAFLPKKAAKDKHNNGDGMPKYLLRKYSVISDVDVFVRLLSSFYQTHSEE